VLGLGEILKVNSHLLVYPMFALVVLTVSVLFRLFRARVGAVSAGEANATYFRTYQDGAEPAASAKLSRHFTNLFEAPILFYAACITAIAANQVDIVLLVLAWAYVAARVVHMLVHTGSNRLRRRIAAYFASWLILIALWIVLVVSVTLEG
jgi:hypothetical protein